MHCAEMTEMQTSSTNVATEQALVLFK